jgi:putative transcriptional regulator
MTRVSRAPPSLTRRGFTALLGFLLVLCPVFLSRADTAPLAVQDTPRTPFDGKPAAGRLLVADRNLQNPYFRRSVILLIDHGDQGTIGVIINRPTALSLSSLSEKFLRAGDADILYYGGPVQPMSFSMLAATDQADDGGRPVLKDVFHVFGAHRIMAFIARLNPLDTVRIYSGYAGWAPGQLDHEIGLGGWHVLPGDSAQIFSENPELLWDELNLWFDGQWL